VGSVYAANTVGAIVGALVFSVLLVGWIGTQHSQQILILVAALSALIAIAPLLLPRRGEAQTAGPLAGALLTAALGLAGWLAYIVPPTSGELIAHAPRPRSRAGPS